MDGREQLRQYLEQRKEAGERELVLDQLSVDELLKLVGAATGATAIPRDASPAASAPPSSDWREVLRSSGASPEKAAERHEVREKSAASGSPQVPQAPPVPTGISVGGSDRQ